MTAARRVGTAEAPTGLGSGDHACWGYVDPARYARDVGVYLREGAARGDRLWYVADKPEREMRRDLASVPRRDTMIEDGQLLLTTSREAFGDDPASFEIGPGLDAYARRVDEAVLAGYQGLRLSVDVTPLAVGGHAQRLPGYELAADRLLASRRMSILCGYDERRTRGLDVLQCVHPLQQRAWDVPFSLHWDGETDEGFRLTGEVDLSATEQFRSALRAAAATSPDELVIDLSRLTFIDAAATRVLAAVVLDEHLDGRRVVLRGPRRTVALCLETFDLSGHVTG